MLIGCMQKQHLPFETSKSIILTFKTPKISINDMAFYSKNENQKELLVFGAGEPIFKLQIDKDICLNGQCVSKADFVSEYISKEFPASSFDDILDGRPMHIDGSTIEKTENGFIQNASGSSYDITYKVDKKNILFVEKNRKIIIKIEEIEE